MNSPASWTRRSCACAVTVALQAALLHCAFATELLIPDPLEAGWKGKPVCEKIHEDKKQRILRCTFPPGVGHEVLNIGETTATYLIVETL